jgi:DNA helicase-2/ATP-dependent DNA helicase PcrA
VSLYAVFRRASEYPELKNSAGKLMAFTDIVEEMRSRVGTMELVSFYSYVCDRTGYVQALMDKNDLESRSRIENVQELASSILGFLENEPENPTLAGFLDEVALYTDLDETNDSDNTVTLMTMHAAKGLEFPCVYVVGMEDGLFPGNRAMGDEEEMEEERRLCYVAMTRAKEKLTLTNARQRTLFGRTTPCMPSRFLAEIPEGDMEWIGKPELRPTRREWDGGWDDAFGYGESFHSRPVERSDDGDTPHIPRQETYRQRGTSAALHRGGGGGIPLLQLQPGDSVSHSAFGQGMVLSVRPMGGDALVEVAFDQVGTKKLMLKAAGQHLKKL